MELWRTRKNKHFKRNTLAIYFLSEIMLFAGYYFPASYSVD
ncbi:hypothetical protein BN137_3783 [Cronobacter condimenti 1330]|uniref:Uncharacterized protein n=1 Tax=Cronobacter condimenti 1330 TaxID=1073999 RepID=K8A431_9ENTR|nr:hypothetical protein BN137_3783 [Cronobacter condimenti 1330]